MKLCVNVDHIATIRQARRIKEPDPVLAASLAELGGADGIVVHLREDRRHIQERDLALLKETVKTQLNLEMAVTEEMRNIAILYLPDMVTLVPEKREELTTEGGLDLKANSEKVQKLIESLNKYNILISIFVDPVLEQVELAAKCGANLIELHTGCYAEAKSDKERETELHRLIKARDYALSLGLEVSAGHGLNYYNIIPIARLENIKELNIGHSIVARSVFVGFERAVKEMKELIMYAQSLTRR